MKVWSLASLRAIGWRILKVPIVLDCPGLGLILHWGAAASWVAIPPEDSSLEAERFKGRNAAARWATAMADRAAG